MRLALLTVFAVLGVSSGAAAQPGPGPPFTERYARGVVARYRGGQAQVGDPFNLSNRIAARWEMAEALDDARQRWHAVPEFVEPAATTLFEQGTGVALADLPDAVAQAYRQCADEARDGHGLDDKARNCMGRDQPFLDAHYALLPARAFSHPVGGANQGAALYAKARKALKASPTDRELRRQVAAMELATWNFREAIRVLGTLPSNHYDEAVTRAEAHRRLEEWAAARRWLEIAIELSPRRPEAHHNLGRVLRETPDDARAGDDTIRAYHHMLSYLCLRSGARLSEPDHGVEAAVQYTVELDRSVHGGSYWFYSSERGAQPPPFLPAEALPGGWSYHPADLEPRQRCDTAIEKALQGVSFATGEDVVLAEDAASPSTSPSASSSTQPALVRPRLPPRPSRVAPSSGGCGTCAVGGSNPRSMGWLLVAVAVAVVGRRRLRPSA